LRGEGGALITVGSIASELPTPIMGAYAASKHAIRGYVRSLRIELQTDAPSVSVTLVKPSGIDTPIGQHSLNREGGEAQIPPPVYDPQLVADAILACAAFPRREVTVGGAGRAQVLFGEHFPTLFEKLAPIMGKLLTDRTRDQPGPANLFASARAGLARSGEHAPRTTSLYTTAQLNPMASATIVSAGLAVGAIALIELLRPRPRAKG
ncbi:MAG: SDR family NAD(P)-dependent oxidoreductase, partial [Sphingomonas sp.]